MARFYNRSCNVLIIGGGFCWPSCRIEADDAGAHVLIISKSRKGDPHTGLARGGINAAWYDGHRRQLDDTCCRYTPRRRLSC